MTRTMKCLSLLVAAILISGGVSSAQKTKTEAPDLTREPTLYVVAYAHLDSQWRWDYRKTILEYIPNTMRRNFELFEKYPHYAFNFSGAYRYRLMEEYYPDDFQKVKAAVHGGRWFPAGSAVEECDVNVPSAESLIRQILYGKQYFRKTFGKTSVEFMLPDCFGFPASLPSILAHAGIKGFSTQKLSSSWQPAARVGGPDSPQKTPEGIPFNVGLWEGPDGRTVLAALNPGSYVGLVLHDLSDTPLPLPDLDRLSPEERRLVRHFAQREDWPKRIRINGDRSGLYTDYHYYGTGDIGGAPAETSVKIMEAIVTGGRAALPDPVRVLRRHRGEDAPDETERILPMGRGPVKVIAATAEQMFLDIRPEQTAKLPRYKGDLELISHSAGSLTSQAAMKRWNRMNEVLADNAEKASVAAALLGGRPYPTARLTDAWTLVAAGQMHDILPGTSIPKAYEYSWNDQVLAMNQFAGVLTSAVQSVASAMNTRTRGASIVVYNGLSLPREDVVEAAVAFASLPKAVRVTGPDGSPVPAQVNADGTVVFVAKAPPAGFAVYDVEPAEAPAASALKVTASSLENARYAVTLDENGDIAGLFDKRANREILKAPARLAISDDNPQHWPAWNMDWDQVSAPPRAHVGGPVKTRIIENGPARVALEVTREAEGSTFIQTLRLSEGAAGNRLEIACTIDWRGREANLKAVFPLAIANDWATYNWDIGTIERPTADERQFEVASHQWVDLTDRSGRYGVTLLTDAKYGSDKPDESTLRLTLLRTPGVRGGYEDQATQDWGRHRFVYGLAGHEGGYREAQTDWQAFRLNQPLAAFESPRHDGPLGKTFSLMRVGHSRIRVLAVKKAEESDEVIVRMVAMDGEPAENVRVTFAAPVTSAREVNGAEEPVGPALVEDGTLVTSFTAFQPRTFALKLGEAPARAAAVRSQAAALEYDLAVASHDGTKPAAGFDSENRTLAAEMLPAEIDYAGVRFKLAPAATGTPNAIAARGQTIDLPAGSFDRVYVLAASAEGDQKAVFRVGDKAFEVVVQDWGGMIGQLDNRVWKSVEVTIPERAGAPARTVVNPYGEMVGLTPGFIKTAPVAWYASHRHTAEGANDPYAYSYLFAVSMETPGGAGTLTLPDNARIRILAVSVAAEGPKIRPAQPLTDALEPAGR